MASLKEVADLAQTSMLTAFHILNQNGDSEHDDALRQRVQAAAKKLKYQNRITQIDVADLAGVAKGTVSYALNGSELIKAETREKVLEAAKALGYSMNITARNLRTNRANVIGYSWHVADDPGRMNNVLDRFIYRVTMAAEAHNHHLLTFIQPQQDADLTYETLLNTARVDGFIISDVKYNDSRIARLSAMDAPFAAFGGMFLENPEFAFVDVDGNYGMKLVVNYLLEQGHERIGLLTRRSGTPYGDARERGYQEAMHDAGIKIHEDWISYTPNILHSAALATQQLMSISNPPTAIICTNDLMAFGAKSYLDERGIHIPDDVALIGYDDDPTSEFLGISSVRQPIDELAGTLVDILLGEINQAPVAKRQVIFYPELVIRASTMRR
jgi:DNA-binding LacI/PurR family transcriptional regulator